MCVCVCVCGNWCCTAAVNVCGVVQRYTTLHFENKSMYESVHESEYLLLSPIGARICNVIAANARAAGWTVSEMGTVAHVFGDVTIGVLGIMPSASAELRRRAHARGRTTTIRMFSRNFLRSLKRVALLTNLVSLVKAYRLSSIFR